MRNYAFETSYTSLMEKETADKPRERLERLGIEALSDKELLMLLIGSGSAKRKVEELADDLLSNLDSNPKLSAEDIRKKNKIYTPEELIAKPSDEEGVDIILSLAGERTLKTNINIPNSGQVGYLGKGHIVESNGYISANSIVPIVSTNPSLSIQAMVQRIEAEQDIALEAILENDMDELFEAFILDPLVNIPIDKAHELFDRMLTSCALRY